MKPYNRIDGLRLSRIAEETGAPRPPEPAHHRILAVDDDDVILDLLSQTLASQRYDVDVARTCEDALPKILFNDYSGILIDLVLPDTNGLGLFRQIARRRPAMRSRVAFVTGALDTGEAVRLVRLVNVPVLRKPFDLADLISTVRHLTLADS